MAQKTTQNPTQSDSQIGTKTMQVLDLQLLLSGVELILEGDDEGEDMEYTKIAKGMADVRAAVRRLKK